MPCPLCGNPDVDILKPELLEWIRSTPKAFRVNTHKRVIVLASVVLGPFFCKIGSSTTARANERFQFSQRTMPQMRGTSLSIRWQGMLQLSRGGYPTKRAAFR